MIRIKTVAINTGDWGCAVYPSEKISLNAEERAWFESLTDTEHFVKVPFDRFLEDRNFITYAQKAESEW